MKSRKLIVATIFVPDHWNPAKTWVITRTGQRKYRTNQMIHGRLFYKKFRPCSKYGVSEATMRTFEELHQLFSS